MTRTTRDFGEEMTRFHRAARAACSALMLALTACGGGTTTTIIIEPGALGKQWRGTELSDRALAIVPGGGYALVGDVPAVDWLAFQTAGAVVDLRQASYGDGAWQAAASPRVSGLHGVVFNEDSAMARAGDWTVVLGRQGQDLWAQLTGPSGQQSAAVPLSSTADGHVHVAVDAAGHARVYWSETSGATTVVRAMHFSGTTPVDDGQIAAMTLDGLGTVAGPDGQGWLFYAHAGRHHVRTVDALNGLGAAQVLDEPALGTVAASRRSVAETASRVSSLAVQGSGTAGACVGARRLDAGIWSATTCVNDSLADAGTRLLELAVEPGGRAVAVWAGGTDDHTLYAALRDAAGAWSAPRVLGVLAAGVHLATVTARVHTDGSAIVLYRQADGATPNASVPENAVPYAVRWDAAAGAWSPPERIDAAGQPSARLAVAFNSRGEPGVLNVVETASAGRYQVRFAARLKGVWSSVSLQDDASLATVLDGHGDLQLASMLRLVSLGDGGWAAFWELSSNLVPGFGRRVVAAAYQ